jgi:hypothetical protein
MRSAELLKAPSIGGLGAMQHLERSTVKLADLLNLFQSNSF